MASFLWSRSNQAQHYELHAPAAQIDDDVEEVIYSNRRGGRHHAGNLQKNTYVHDLSTGVSFDGEPSQQLLGKPAVKKRLNTLDIVAVGSSLLCLALAIAAVADESLSWRLGTGNDQLIVVGFLLSIMSLSLNSVAPTLFLLLEARFGPSTLQNYDAITRNQVLSSRLSLVWRLVLALMAALPLALSAAYKNFAGGESVMKVDAINYIGNTSFYGTFSPPGVQSATGVSLFSNATIPFASATSSQNGSEPHLPAQAQAYGFNILLLNNETTAMLDIPQTSYVSAVQELLAVGESWNISAPVTATVATFNHSKVEDPRAYASYCEAYCEAAVQSQGAYTISPMLNGWGIGLLDHASPGNQNLQYVSFIQNSELDYTPSCSEFCQSAKAYDINRQFCEGTWSITRGGIQLIDGSCNGTILPPKKQTMILQGNWFVGVWIMSSLIEFIGPFATTRNESHWIGPYMATSMAAMSWSKIAAAYGSPSLWESEFSPASNPDLLYGDSGLIYSVDDTAVYVRPTLQKSALLYCVFAIQPLLTIVALGLVLILHSTPVDRGFGLISILSGIRPTSLNVLDGAGLSGELRKDIKLVINPVRNDQRAAIEYHVALSSKAPSRNGTLRSGIQYY